MAGEAKRRSHKKSRKGCNECKKRHLKCDETRPSCVNCDTASMKCSFKHEALRPQDTRHGSSVPVAVQTPTARLTPQYNVLSTGLPSPSSYNEVQQDTPAQSPFEPSTATRDEFNLNMTHLQLLHHFSTHTVLSFQKEQRPHPTATIAVRAALAEPYLMSVLLAFSALHLSTIYPDLCEFYKDQAHGLQTRALSLFNKYERINVTAENCLQRFLFASFLGLHMLCDVLFARTGDFGEFLDQFIGYMKIHRGVKAVSGESWHMLLNTELREVLLSAAERGEKANASHPHNGPCERLTSLLRDSDLSPPISQIYLESISCLERILAAYDPEHGSESITRWTVTIPVEFIDLLAQRRPEALVILAHWAVLLIYHDELWFVGNSGSFIIESVSKHLGRYWESWLEWPTSQLLTLSNDR